MKLLTVEVLLASLFGYRSFVTIGYVVTSQVRRRAVTVWLGVMVGSGVMALVSAGLYVSDVLKLTSGLALAVFTVMAFTAQSRVLANCKIGEESG